MKKFTIFTLCVLFSLASMAQLPAAHLLKAPRPAAKHALAPKAIAKAPMMRADEDGEGEEEDVYSFALEHAQTTFNMNATDVAVEGAQINDYYYYYGYTAWFIMFTDAEGNVVELLVYSDSQNLEAGHFEFDNYYVAISKGYNETQNYAALSYVQLANGGDAPYLFLTSGTVDISFDNGNIVVSVAAESYGGSSVSISGSAAYINPAYAYEPEDVTEINFTATGLEFEDPYTADGYSTIWAELSNTEGDTLNLLLVLPADASQALQSGTYKVLNTVGAAEPYIYYSQGVSGDGSIYGSYYQTPYDEQYDDFYFIVDGEVNVVVDGSNVSISGDLVSARGSVIHVAYSAVVESGLNSVQADQLGAFASNGELHFNANAGEQVRIYDAVGHTVANFRANDGRNTVSLPQGLFMLNVSNKVAKVVVK